MRNFWLTLGAVLTGFIIYDVFIKRKDETPLQFDMASPLLTQPSQLYPFEGIEGVRTDIGSDQPWSALTQSELDTMTLGEWPVDVQFTANTASQEVN